MKNLKVVTWASIVILIVAGITVLLLSSKPPTLQIGDEITEEANQSDGVLEGSRAVQADQGRGAEVAEADLSNIPNVGQLKEVLAAHVQYTTPEKLIFTYVEMKRQGIYGKAGLRGGHTGFHFVASLQDDKWSIGYAGQDSVPCALVEKYKFTEDSIPVCWDSDAGAGKRRADARAFTPLPNQSSAPGIAPINQYYERLAKGNLAEAYALHTKPYVDYAEFEGWYQDIRSVELKDLIHVSGSEYEIILAIREKDKEPVTYRVKTLVRNGLLDTSSSEEVIGNNYYFEDGVLVVGLRKGNHFYLLTEKDGMERIIQESKYDKDSEKPQAEYFVPRYSNPRFEYDNNLLFYTTSGWEYTALNVFDLRQNKVIFTRGFPMTHGFNKDKSLYYDCNDFGLASTREIKVWRVPGFEEVATTDREWIALKYSNYQCRYDKWTNALMVSLDKPMESHQDLPQQQTLQYPLNSVGEIQKNLKGIAEDECLASPRMLGIGREVYPINEKYKAVHFLGQLFTASDCGPERVQKIWGVSGDTYGLGVHVYFVGQLPAELMNLLDEIGFEQDDSCAGAGANTCDEWFLRKNIFVTELLKLKSYVLFMSDDDCLNCG